MSGRGTFLTELIGLGVSILALLVSVALPIMNGPRTSWREAMVGILPSAFLALLFLFVTLLGMFFMMNNRQRDGRPRRRDYGDDWDDDPPRRRTRRPRPDFDEASD